MNCDRCNKDGAKPYKYKEGGEFYTVNLCEDCFNVLSGNAKQGSNQSLLNMQRRCPSCGRSLSEIRKTGYFGCANCFSYFKAEIIRVIDKYQGGVISSPDKKRKELEVMLLEDEYVELLSTQASGANSAVVNNRLAEIEVRLASLGVRIDE